MILEYQHDINKKLDTFVFISFFLCRNYNEARDEALQI
jgi:hypothetical protein